MMTPEQQRRDAVDYAYPAANTAEMLLKHKMLDVVHNAFSQRREFLQGLMDPRRNIDDECGYPTSIRAEDYKKLYERMAVAARTVEVFPKESWQVQPTIYETEDADNKTQFEEAWDKLNSLLTAGGGSWYQKEEGGGAWEILQRADILSGVGHYGVVLIGIDDGKDLSEPADFVNDPEDFEPEEPEEDPYAVDYVSEDDLKEKTPEEEQQAEAERIHNAAEAEFLGKKRASEDDSQQAEDPEGEEEPKFGPPEDSELSKAGGPGKKPKPFKAKHKVLYVRCFDESLAQITQYEQDQTNPRFGQPTMYLLTFADPREEGPIGTGMTTASKNVHWTRVIHLADNRTSSQVFGVPRMRAVWNNLQDLAKLYGGSAEMYWRGAFPGFSIETHPQLGGEVSLDIENMRSQMEQYMNGLQRYLAMSAVGVKSLAPQVVDPTPQINTQLEAICIKLGIPKRIFMGSERGELASSQDDGSWNDRLRHRQNTYLTPCVVVPFVDRLIQLGVLPVPAAGYYCEWPDLDAASASEKATNAAALTQALATYISGNIEAIMTPMDFLTRILGMTEDAAQAVLDASEEATAGLSEERWTQDPMELQQQELDMQQQMIDDDQIPDQIIAGGGPPNGQPPPNGEGNGKFPPQKQQPPKPPQVPRFK